MNRKAKKIEQCRRVEWKWSFAMHYCPQKRKPIEEKEATGRIIKRFSLNISTFLAAPFHLMWIQMSAIGPYGDHQNGIYAYSLGERTIKHKSNCRFEGNANQTWLSIECHVLISCVCAHFQCKCSSMAFDYSQY